MSLQEAYSLAHTAQCRLQLAASRPDRTLRFVVGHLTHYESLRLRIVEIEHDIRRRHRAKSVQFQVNDHRWPQGPPTAPLRITSPPPPPPEAGDHIENVDDEVLFDDDDEGFNDAWRHDGEEDLGLQRFPSSASSRPSQPPPDLEPDDDDDDDDSDEEDDGPASPGEPDQATLEHAMEGEHDGLMVTMYEGVRECVCRRKSDAPKVRRMWEFPSAGKAGVGVAGLKARAVAQVA